VLYDDESRFLADPNAARAAADRSLAITRRYAALAPTRENLEFLAIGLLHDAAYYQSKETLATWTSQLAESIEIFHKLAATGLATIDFRAQHAFAHKRMGSLLAVMHKDYTGAAVHYVEALEIDEALAKQHPDRADLRYNLTFTENDLAGIEMHAGKFDEALSHINDVLTIREEMRAADPNDTRARDGVASADQTMSDLLATQKHYPAAFDYARRSVELMGGANQTPTVRLARGLHRMGVASLGWAKSGRADSAEHLAAASIYYNQALAMFNELNSRAPLALPDSEFVKFIQSDLAEIGTLRSK
jgi:tetratricopeptide (TPR) repeat protein